MCLYIIGMASSMSWLSNWAFRIHQLVSSDDSSWPRQNQCCDNVRFSLRADFPGWPRQPGACWRTFLSPGFPLASPFHVLVFFVEGARFTYSKALGTMETYYYSLEKRERIAQVEVAKNWRFITSWYLRCRDDGNGTRWNIVNKKVGYHSVVSQNEIKMRFKILVQTG